MAYWLVTDSDWEWTDTIELAGVPTIVEADTPEDACKKAVAEWEEQDHLDGVHCKVSRVETLGFYGCNRNDAGDLEWDAAFQPVEP